MVNLSPRSGCCNQRLRIADSGFRIAKTFGSDFAFAVEQTHKSAVRNPQSLLPTPHSRSENHPPLIEIAPDDDGFVGPNFAAEEFHRQRVLDHILNGAFQRTRAVDRVKALARQKLFGRIVEPKSDLALFEHAAQRFELNLDDPAQLLDPQALEDDHVVDAVEELRLELRAQLVHHPRAHYVLIALPLLNVARPDV